MAMIDELLRFRLFSLGGVDVEVSTLLVALIVAVISLWVARLAEKGVARFMNRRGVTDEGSIGTTQRLVHYAILALGLAIAVQTLGINLNALFAAGAFLAVALGFAMQNITQNFVSGLILLLERTIKPGDIIEVDGKIVRVTTLGMRATVTRTLDSEDLIIPNSVLVAATVKNYTLRDKLYRVRTIVGVIYGSDMRQVREILEKTTRALDWRVESYEPVIFMKGFGSSSVDFDVSVWIDDPFACNRAQSQLNEAIWFALKDAGITIAFPQLDVHVDPPIADSLRRIADERS